MQLVLPKPNILVQPTSIQVRSHMELWWDSKIQAGRQSRAKVIAKKGSHQVYNTIPKFKEWLTINCEVNVVGGSIPRFYIFHDERIRGDYNMHYKPGTCMAVRTKAWMTSFLFKEFLSFFKGFSPRWYFKQPSTIRWTWFTC